MAVEGFPTARGVGPVPDPPAETLRGLVLLHRRISGLAAAEDGPAAVTRLLAEQLGAVAAVVSADGSRTVLAAAAPETDDRRAAAVVRAEVAESRWERVLAGAARSGRAMRVPGRGTWVRVVVPVEVAGEVTAFLLAEEDPTHRSRSAALDGSAADDVLLLAAEHAATIVGVLLGRQRVLAAAAGQVRDDLVSGLLLGRARSAAEAAQWAEHVGLELAGTAYRVMVVVPDDGAEPVRVDLLTAARDRLARLVPDVRAVLRDRELVAVVPGAVDPAELSDRLAGGLVRGRGPWPVTITLGREVDDLAGLARSYDQARRTVDAARRLGRQGRLLRFEDLGVHRLLLQVPDPEDARVFAREVLGRLVDADSGRAGDLVRTLARYFREDGSPQRTAKALSVHPNTVGYRLRRAEELSGLVLDHYPDRLAAQVALEILGYMEDE
ncbi:helix-turn-helix domain-containing protein [Actinomycetospora sp. OC33-EN08]|uniref:Helix-turn-helix domain-containing protein n=1 Tax=Actinomycetospora aurantiaca TaxID=3129233 RepID=A0ABU8MKD0_9PSEU